MSDKEYILCAAVHYRDGKRYAHSPKNIANGLVVCGRRHHNIFSVMYEIVPSEKRRLQFKKDTIQGFLTSKDRFVDRTEAATIAYEAGQTKKNEMTLMSEHLY